MTSSDAIGIWGLLVSVIGFGLTVWQLIRTASAAEKTKTAVENAANRMVTNHMLVMLPQLKSAETELDAAIVSNDSKGAIRALIEYSYAAKQIASLLSGEGQAEYTDLIERLRTSADSASGTKSALVTGTPRPLKDVVATISSDISKIAGDCVALATTYQAKVS